MSAQKLDHLWESASGGVRKVAVALLSDENEKAQSCLNDRVLLVRFEMFVVTNGDPPSLTHHSHPLHIRSLRVEMIVMTLYPCSGGLKGLGNNVTPKIIVGEEHIVRRRLRRGALRQIPVR